MDNPLFVAIGLVAGLLAGVFGIGGGIVIVPALILLAPFTPQVATGTSLAMFLLPIGLLGASVYYRQGDVRVVAAFAAITNPQRPSHVQAADAKSGIKTTSYRPLKN